MGDYKKGMKAIFYTETDEIEFMSEDKIIANMYFKNIDELVELIRTSPRLAEALREAI